MQDHPDRDEGRIDGQPTIEPSLTQRQWTWHVPVALADIWSIMADTARFNEAAGLPKHEIIEKPQADGSVRYFATGRVSGFPLRWEEFPVNWEHERWFEHRRAFTTGPLGELIAHLAFAATDEGCDITVTVTATARNIVGWIMLKTRFWHGCRQMYGDRITQAQRFIEGRQDQPFDFPNWRLSPEKKTRAEAMVRAIEESGFGHGQATRLLEVLITQQEVDLVHLRPLAFARQAKMEERESVELFLQATREGLLELRWDVLCPRCRIPKAQTGSLDRLPKGAHCGTCNIDYDSDFSSNVELSFTPAANLRPVDLGEYCLFGPLSTPHILLHLTLAPGEQRTLEWTASPGFYRWRSLEPGPAVNFHLEDGQSLSLGFDDEDAWAEPQAGEGGMRLENRSSRPLTLILEERAWARDALTADRVTSLQAFRDLFSDQVLRPGEEVAVRQIALLFTDLKGSTALYEKSGDANAYHLVREHFAYLSGIVREYEGAVIKTIGDAVMASFIEPGQALKAALDIQDRIAGLNGRLGEDKVVIKLGIHLGPAIAVTLNDRLDYFGQTVNLAARLQGESQGGDIVLSQEFVEATEAAESLEGRDFVWEEASLKGVSEPVPFLRVI